MGGCTKWHGISGMSGISGDYVDTMHAPGAAHTGTGHMHGVHGAQETVTVVGEGQSERGRRDGEPEPTG